MTVAEIKDKLTIERGFGSRYPVRVIFAENLDDYLELESMLKSICDTTVNLADFCSSPDTVPRLDKIKGSLSEWANQQVLLLSVGEYLRICLRRELNADRCQLLSFWELQQPEASKTRIIVPLFCCKNLFNRIVKAVDERQQDYVWDISSSTSSQNYDITVYSPDFLEAIKPDAESLSDWLQNWQSILKKHSSAAITTMQHANVENISAAVTTKSVANPFQYLSTLLSDGDSLEEKWLSNDSWMHIVEYALHGIPNNASFSTIILMALNVYSFEFVPIAARWKTLTEFQKTLVWLWYRVYPAHDYYSFACLKASVYSEIPDRIRDEILLLKDPKDSWITERTKAVKALSFMAFDDSYFNLVSKLPTAEAKLKMLTYQTFEEKAYCIRIVSSMLRNGETLEPITALLKDDYPALASYLTDATGCDNEADEYLAWYRKNKLINRYPSESWQRLDLEKFDSRYKLVSKFKGKDCVFFWIDGFGAEYAPLFLRELKAKGIVPESVKLGTAILPTETEYNHQWNDDPLNLKWDRLDTLSHHGMPDDKSYYLCIAHQLSIFEKAAQKVSKLLEEHNYVVVTGDHGSSRLAALAFHDDSVVSITAPQNAIVRSFGRFCEFTDTNATIPFLQNATRAKPSSEKICLAMDNYQHFTASGNAAGRNSDELDVAGEVHGGNTPEERLVSVIAIKRKNLLPTITCKPENQSAVKINGHIETTLNFSRPIEKLEVEFNGHHAICKPENDRSWLIELDGISAKEKLTLSITANGCVLPDVQLLIKTSGISANKDPFGDMGI